MTDDFDSFVCLQGIPIAADWSKDLGLLQSDAETAIRLLAGRGRPLLGGDVFHRFNGEIAPAYANWSRNRRKDKSIDNYVQRVLDQLCSRSPKADQSRLLVGQFANSFFQCSPIRFRNGSQSSFNLVTHHCNAVYNTRMKGCPVPIVVRVALI